MNNRIYVHDEITIESYTAFCRRFHFLEKNLPKDKEILIEICSWGGDGSAALAYYHKIRASLRTVVTEAIGTCDSAATLILAAGDTRRMAKTAWVMVHEDQIAGDTGGSTADQEREISQCRRRESQWCQLFADRTGTSASYWESINRETTYLDPEECLSLGLIHEITGE